MSAKTPPATINLLGLTVRKISRSDLSALEWEGQYQRYRRVFASLYSSVLNGKTLMWIVETREQKIIGQAFVMLHSSDRDAADGSIRAYIFSFRIRPEWQNKGVGTGLMEFVEADLYQRGFSFTTLNVAKDNPAALRLYQRLGYKIIGSRSGIWSYIDHNGVQQHVNEPAWRMMKKIRPD